ncbi:MAG: 2-amino-4-hydroxy-6-hydroxymethyldihydropteridine diphosphokinase [Prevotella sp.]|nr:2-amino-4-hydroxy-6-hydroxymethyldihydropteridine diphosphokinase [Prevotella sp.]
MKHVVYLSLGSNLGNKKANIRKAIKRIGELVGTVERRSALYETEPWGFQSEHLFVNAAVCCTTDLSPQEVLHVTQQIEREMGRRQKTAQCEDSSASPVYHDRPIDIDILLYDDLHVDEPELKIPHPLMQMRDFVMIPLKEILRPIGEDQEPLQWHDSD